ncbi:competence type IV pilus ATPase ComGA [Fictibacillus aquaticus]|uniref:competence type IV pilus ATPase ComGA n=1 Tax=Fictibacillus aquaticus TaxID=2021314 RepID=UPI001F0A6EA8|nr:competence type IV pilus ATPase ComGA [Fictibacillus aquaticus]
MSIETVCNALIDSAMELKASDIHFVPKKQEGLIQFRVDDRLIEVKRYPYPFFRRMLSHFKFKARMDVGEVRRPQSGAMDLNSFFGTVHLRLSAIPSAYHESLVIRILPQNDFFSMNELSLFSSQINILSRLIKRASGLILFTGPTGSGKTTMLYSLLHHLQHQMNRQIVTLEDPVERKVETFLQMEINEKAGVTYGEGFKSILRHDPDVIMIGEIRDSSTAELVVNASLSGHLVLSTLHASDCCGALMRLKEFGIGDAELKQTLLAVASQRLVSLVCPYCEEQCSGFCFKRRKNRRAGVYEILSGFELEKCWRAISNNEQLLSGAFRRLPFYLRHGNAMGFIQDESYVRWTGAAR